MKRIGLKIISVAMAFILIMALSVSVVFAEGMFVNSKIAAQAEETELIAVGIRIIVNGDIHSQDDGFQVVVHIKETDEAIFYGFGLGQSDQIKDAGSFYGANHTVSFSLTPPRGYALGEGGTPLDAEMLMSDYIGADDPNFEPKSVVDGEFLATFYLDYVGGNDTPRTSISTAQVSAIPDQTYTGNTIMPEPTVMLGEQILTLGTDYDLYYYDNVNVGTAKVDIVGRGNYDGLKSVTFQIVAPDSDPTPAAPPSDPNTGGGIDNAVSDDKANMKVAKVSASKPKAGKKSIKLSWKKVKSASGYQIQYRQSGKSKWSAKTAKAKATSITIKKLKAGKKYQVRVRAFKKSGGKTTYGPWSKTYTVKVKK